MSVTIRNIHCFPNVFVFLFGAILALKNIRIRILFGNFVGRGQWTFNWPSYFIIWITRSIRLLRRTRNWLRALVLKMAKIFIAKFWKIKNIWMFVKNVLQYFTSVWKVWEKPRRKRSVFITLVSMNFDILWTAHTEMQSSCCTNMSNTTVLTSF